METKVLLEKLMDLERKLQRGECSAAQALLLDAQEDVLQIEREMIDMRTRLSASVAPSYRTVAGQIKKRQTSNGSRIDARRDADGSQNGLQWATPRNVLLDVCNRLILRVRPSSRVGNQELLSRDSSGAISERPTEVRVAE